ncbi:Putative MFS transporter [Candidatus Hydrogenisulfobacillus filiaventi]|uniref:MFS transporter n=1 Tax=Candidatus Hydrogenisulfobacillus filiaventi TaxID=2707344 RepID=A0A6F8ZKE9_9FIRM|nr:MFS transporter [Bacillota bacterium]CAB1130240.1 Putative MFS transporter [Candidatus Hydrogenisulfobacillus filiaventi]
MAAGRAGERPRLWTAAYVRLDLVSFAFFTGFYLYTSTFQFFVLDRGADVADLGLVLAVLTLTAVGVRPLIGPLLDAAGRRPVLLTGLAAMAAASLLYLVSGPLWQVVLIRMLQGVGWSMSTTAASTFIADVVPPSRQGEAMGFYSNFTDLAMAVGPFLGVYLSRGDRFAPLFWAGGAWPLAALLLAAGLRERRRPGGGRWRIRFRLEPRALWPAGVLFAVTFAYAAVLGYLPPFLRGRGLGPGYADFYVAYAAVLLLTRGLWGRLYDARGRAWALVPGLVLVAGSMLWLPAVHRLPGLLLFAVLFGLGFGAAQPATLAWTVERVPSAVRGQAIGTYYTAFDGGMAVAYAGIGAVIAHSSYPVGFTLTSAVVGLALAAFLAAGRRAPDGSAKEEDR